MVVNAKFWIFNEFILKFEKIWTKPMKKINKKSWMNKCEKFGDILKFLLGLNNLDNEKENGLGIVKVQC